MTQGSFSPSVSAQSSEQIKLRLEGLQHEIEKGGDLVRRLRWLAFGLLALLILLLVALHLFKVMQYATVASVEAVEAEKGSGTAVISYAPLSAGKIEFVRRSAGLAQTLTEHVREPGPNGQAAGKFTWSGRAGDEPTLEVTYRGGLFLVTRNLPLTPAAPPR